MGQNLDQDSDKNEDFEDLEYENDLPSPNPGRRSGGRQRSSLRTSNSVENFLKAKERKKASSVKVSSKFLPKQIRKLEKKERTTSSPPVVMKREEKPGKTREEREKDDEELLSKIESEMERGEHDNIVKENKFLKKLIFRMKKQNKKFRHIIKKKNEKINRLKKEKREQKFLLKKIYNDIEQGKKKLLPKKPKDFEKTEENWMLSLKFMNKRDQKVKEFFFTEKRYVDNLTMLKTEYINEIRKQKLMQEKEFLKIFGNFDLIYNINKTFLKKLEEVLFSKYKDELLVELCLSFSKSFKLYSSYIKNYAQVHDLLTRLIKKSKKLETFLNMTARRLKKINPQIESTICGLRILPVQRLPRYLLLLRDLVKYTKKETQQYTKLEEAVKTIREILDYCEQQSKEHEDKMNLVNLSKKLNLTLIQKKLLYSTESIFRIDRKGNEIDASFYVFNDQVVLKDNEKGFFTQAKQFQIPLIRNETVMKVTGNQIEWQDPVLEELSAKCNRGSNRFSFITNLKENVRNSILSEENKNKVATHSGGKFTFKIRFVSIYEKNKLMKVLDTINFVPKNNEIVPQKEKKEVKKKIKYIEINKL